MSYAENQTMQEFQAHLETLAETARLHLQASPGYCEIEPGLVEIITGVQQVVDNFVTGSTRQGIDAAFGILILAMKAPC
jgi:hypothetical protein